MSTVRSTAKPDKDDTTRPLSYKFPVGSCRPRLRLDQLANFGSLDSDSLFRCFSKVFRSKRCDKFAEDSVGGGGCLGAKRDLWAQSRDSVGAGGRRSNGNPCMLSHNPHPFARFADIGDTDSQSRWSVLCSPPLSNIRPPGWVGARGAATAAAGCKGQYGPRSRLSRRGTHSQPRSRVWRLFRFWANWLSELFVSDAYAVEGARGEGGEGRWARGYGVWRRGRAFGAVLRPPRPPPPVLPLCFLLRSGRMPS